MQKLTVAISAVAASVLIAMSAQAAEIYNKDSNKLDVYGKVNAKHYFSSNDHVDGDHTYARLGFKGETQISDQMTGFGQWEYEFKGNHAESQGAAGDKTRLAFAGLKFGDYGSVDYGRNYGVAYDIGAWTDVLPEFGGDTWTQTDVFMTQRATGVATYRNHDFFGMIDGLNFAVQYQGKNDRNGADYTKGNGDGFGLSTTYEYEGFGIGATYAKSDRTDAQVNAGKMLPAVFASGKNAEVWAAGLKYDANNLYLATTYSETQNMTTFAKSFIANKAQNFEVVAQYQFDFGLRPSLAYLQSKGKELGIFGDQDLVKYIDVGATYSFNKNMSTFIDYKINLLDKNDFTGALDINTDNIVAVGMVYQF